MCHAFELARANAYVFGAHGVKADDGIARVHPVLLAVDDIQVRARVVTVWRAEP